MAKIRERQDLVVYTRQSTNLNWEKFRLRKEEVLKEKYNNLSMPDYAQVGQQLKDLGMEEQEKEIQLIQMYFPNFTMTDMPTFITKINEILQGKKAFEKAVRRLTRAIDQGTDKGQLAPYITSFMSEKFVSYLTEEVRRIFKTGLTVQDIEDKWEENLEEITNRAFERALTDLFTNFNKSNQDGIWGNKGEYDDLYQLWQNVEDKTEFYDLVRGQLGIVNLKKLLQNIATPQGLRPKQISTAAVGRALHVTNQAGQIGGTLAEYFTALVEDGVQVKSKMAKTDIVTVHSSNIAVDLQALTQEIESAITNAPGPKSLISTAQALAEKNEELSALSDTFVVYTSQKMYGMGKSFAGFHTSTDTAISELQAIKTMANAPSTNNIDDLVAVMYNTIPGAVFGSSKDRQQIHELVKAQIAEWFAYTLFDDWTTIGQNTGISSIHVMNLDSINIPVSVLLQLLGDTIIQTESFSNTVIRTSLTTPTDILYYSWLDYPQLITDFGVVPDTSQAWFNQAEDAKNKVKFSTKILLDFKNRVWDWVNQIKG